MVPFSGSILEGNGGFLPCILVLGSILEENGDFLPCILDKMMRLAQSESGQNISLHSCYVGKMLIFVIGS